MNLKDKNKKMIRVLPPVDKLVNKAHFPKKIAISYLFYVLEVGGAGVVEQGLYWKYGSKQLNRFVF